MRVSARPSPRARISGRSPRSTSTGSRASAACSTSRTARAFGRTDLAAFSAAGLAELLADRPLLWRHVSQMLSRRLRLAMLVLRDNSVAPLPERIARRVLAHALSSDLRSVSEVKVRMTQADLALMLGASRSKTNAALKMLETRGLVDAGYRGITILDVPKLRAFAGTDVQAF